jgi:hypothetical protein
VADYLSELTNKLTSLRSKRGLNNAVDFGSDPNQLRTQYQGLQSDLDGFLSGLDGGLDGAMPSRNKFVKVGTQRENRLVNERYEVNSGYSFMPAIMGERQVSKSFESPTLAFDKQGYAKGVFDFLKKSSRYAGWSDEDLTNLANDMAGAGTDAEASGKQFWAENQHAQEQANKDTIRDRNTMLAELSQYRAQSILSNETFERVMAEEEQKERGANMQTLAQISQQYAQMGRQASPYLLAGVAQKLSLASRDKLFVRRAQLELDRSQLQQDFLGRLYQVLGETKRSVIDPATAAGIMEKLGAASSNVESVQV